MHHHLVSLNSNNFTFVFFPPAMTSVGSFCLSDSRENNPFSKLIINASIEIPTCQTPKNDQTLSIVFTYANVIAFRNKFE